MLSDAPQSSSKSKKQWQLKQYQRRCKECIGANRVTQMTAPPPTEICSSPPPCAVDDDGASCWICLEAGPDEDGQHLIRDCSCRGTDAGFAHLPCIIEYAKQKSQQHHGRNLVKFIEPWQLCPGCRQPYQNELADGLASGFVVFVERQYPDDQWAYLEASNLKFGTIVKTEPIQMEEAKGIADKLLSMIRRIRMSKKSISREDHERTQQIEALTYSDLGRFYLAEETKESAKTALCYFEKYRDISKALGSADGVNTANTIIALFTKEMCGGYSNNEDDSKDSVNDHLKRCQDMYTSLVEREGKDANSSINAGVILANAMNDACHGIEAERLLAKLFETIKRVHGPDHGTTQSAESAFQHIKARIVGAEHDSGKRLFFQALRYKDDGRNVSFKGQFQTSETGKSKMSKQSPLHQSICS